MKILNSTAGCRRRSWASVAGTLIMLSITPNLRAVDDTPPAIPLQESADQSLEALLLYLADFEDDSGSWIDPMSLEPQDSKGAVSDE